MYKSIPKEPMSYKKQKNKLELLTKLKIIKLKKKGGYTNIEIANSYSCHRNTVGNILKDFDKHIKKQDQEKLLNQSLTNEKLQKLMKPLKSKSTRPKSRHPRQATLQQENKIVAIFNEYLTVGAKRMYRYLRRAYSGNHPEVTDLEKSLVNLTLAQIKGVYKRNNLKIKKVRTHNGEVRHLYNYKEIKSFMYLHGDTKHLTDQGALPKPIYEKFKHNNQLPKYEWNVIDAKSRFRFIGYSYHLSSELGLKFNTMVIQFIRAITNNHDTQIELWLDNGIEFCGGSKRKEKEWNNYFSLLNTKVKTYHPGHDVRKNLIERSHRNDDEDFLVARGQFINDKASFLREAKEYSNYFNTIHAHQGINMNGRPPLQVLKDNRVFGAERLITFPTLILEDHIDEISDISSVVRLGAMKENYFMRYPNQTKVDQKSWINIKSELPYLRKNAQNVLTPYQIMFPYKEVII